MCHLPIRKGVPFIFLIFKTFHEIKDTMYKKGELKEFRLQKVNFLYKKKIPTYYVQLRSHLRNSLSHVFYLTLMILRSQERFQGQMNIDTGFPN